MLQFNNMYLQHQRTVGPSAATVILMTQVVPPNMPFSLSVVWLCLVIKSCSLRLRRVGEVMVVWGGGAYVSTHHTMLRLLALFPEHFGSNAGRLFIAEFKCDCFTCIIRIIVSLWLIQRFCISAQQ